MLSGSGRRGKIGLLPDPRYIAQRPLMDIRAGPFETAAPGAVQSARGHFWRRLVEGPQEFDALRKRFHEKRILFSATKWLLLWPITGKI